MDQGQAYDLMQDALKEIANYPHKVENRDLTMSEAVDGMAEIARSTLSRIAGRLIRKDERA